MNPHLPIYPFPGQLVTISLFAISVIQFLFCKSVSYSQLLDSAYKQYHIFVFVWSEVSYFSAWQSLSLSMSLHMALFHHFLWLSNFPLCLCATSTLSVPLDGHSGCFHVLGIVNSASVNAGVQYLFELWFSLDICSGAVLLDLMVALFLVF